VFTARDLKLYGQEINSVYQRGPKKVDCLQCEQPMVSTEIGHRICDSCKREETYLEEFNLENPVDYMKQQRRIARRHA